MQRNILKVEITKFNKMMSLYHSDNGLQITQGQNLKEKNMINNQNFTPCSEIVIVFSSNTVN